MRLFKQIPEYWQNTNIACRTMENDIIFDPRLVFKSFADEIGFKCTMAAVLLLGRVTKMGSGLPLQPSNEHLQDWVKLATKVFDCFMEFFIQFVYFRFWSSVTFLQPSSFIPGYLDHNLHPRRNFLKRMIQWCWYNVCIHQRKVVDLCCILPIQIGCNGLLAHNLSTPALVPNILRNRLKSWKNLNLDIYYYLILK